MIEQVSTPDGGFARDEDEEIDDDSEDVMEVGRQRREILVGPTRSPGQVSRPVVCVQVRPRFTWECAHRLNEKKR